MFRKEFFETAYLSINPKKSASGKSYPTLRMRFKNYIYDRIIIRICSLPSQPVNSYFPASQTLSSPDKLRFLPAGTLPLQYHRLHSTALHSPVPWW